MSFDLTLRTSMSLILWGFKMPYLTRIDLVLMHFPKRLCDRDINGINNN